MLVIKAPSAAGVEKVPLHDRSLTGPFLQAPLARGGRESVESTLGTFGGPALRGARPARRP